MVARYQREVARRFAVEIDMLNTAHTKGLSILARRDSLTEGNWFELLEERRVLLKGCFRDMTLRTLGDQKMIRDYFGNHDLKRDKPRLSGDPQFTLEVRGIFPSDKSGAVASRVAEFHRGEQCPEGLMRQPNAATASTDRLWGLTRNGLWIAIEVYTTKEFRPYKSGGRTEEVATAETVQIKECDPPELCSLTGYTVTEIWSRLGEVVQGWAKHRKNLLCEAEQLAQIVEYEETLLEIITSK